MTKPKPKNKKATVQFVLDQIQKRSHVMAWANLEGTKARLQRVYPDKTITIVSIIKQ